MPIDNTYSPVRLEANGVLTDFDFDFKIYQNTDVKVSTVVRATDVATLKTLGVDYTVTINPVTEGGTIVFTSPPASTLDVLMESNLANTQGVNLSPRGTLKQDQVVQALDRNCRLIQQVYERTERSLIIPTEYELTDLEIPVPLADALIGWNSAGTSFENKVPTSVISDLDITLIAADANKLVGVNNSADGYEIKDINEYTDTVITASDEILFGDATDSNNLKKDTVQGIIDLVPGFASSDITGQSAATVAVGDSFVFADADDSDNLKKDTIQGILDLAPNNFYVGTFTRDMTAATGTVAYTGVGFTPSMIIFFGSIGGTVFSSWGAVQGSNKFSMYRDDGTADETISANYGIIIFTSTGVLQTAEISTYDSDGFTLSWVKTGSPTGTLTVGFIAIA